MLKVEDRKSILRAVDEALRPAACASMFLDCTRFLSSHDSSPEFHRCSRFCCHEVSDRTISLLPASHAG